MANKKKKKESKTIAIKLVLGKKKLKLLLAKGCRVKDAAIEAGVNRETAIPLLNNEVVSFDEELSKGDTLEFVGVIYGG